MPQISLLFMLVSFRNANSTQEAWFQKWGRGAAGETAPLGGKSLLELA
jgi:hypothetical protein